MQIELKKDMRYFWCFYNTIYKFGLLHFQQSSKE